MAWAYGRIVDEADERFKEDWPVVRPMWLRAQTAAIEAMAIGPTDEMTEHETYTSGQWSRRNYEATFAAALSPSREDEGK